MTAEKFCLGEGIATLACAELRGLLNAAPIMRKARASILRITGARQPRRRMADILVLSIDRLATPVGEMLVLADGRGNLRAVDWTDHEARMRRLLRLHYGANGFSLESAPHSSDSTDALRRYFDGELTAIDALPVKTGGTPFQREVWRVLRSIPCGTTISYTQLAVRIGRPEAVRAVGSANGLNPVSVVVPCHRVIGANGSLTGYGGGMERKAWLLKHETGPASIL